MQDSDDDPTVVADEDAIRRIREASGATVDSVEQPDDNDPTVFADEELVRQIRMASSPQQTVSPSAETAPSLIDDAEEDHTVVAADEAIRAIRVAGASAAGATEPAPVRDREQTPIENDADVSVSPAPRTSGQEAADASLDELRRRFAPDTKTQSTALVPRWLIIVGIGIIAILLIAILAVVFVG